MNNFQKIILAISRKPLTMKKQMKVKPNQSKRMTRISREVLRYLRGIAAKGGSAKTPAKVAASRANMAAINARRAQRKAGTEPAISSTL